MAFEKKSWEISTVILEERTVTLHQGFVKLLEKSEFSFLRELYKQILLTEVLFLNFFWYI